MNIPNKTWMRGLAAAAALALVLTGCGGGSGSGLTADPPPAQSLSISGIAAEGAPMDGASVTLTDATGAVVATATAGADGSYTLTVPLTAKAPFVAAASKADITYFSPVAEAKSGTINITKITNLIAAQLSPTGDPSALAAQISSGAATVSAAQVQQVVAAVVEALKPLMTNAGDTIDPLSGTFSANGSGHDQVLMALDIAINPAGATSNITVTVKAAIPEGEQPPAISFTSGSTPPPLPQMVATAQLPSSDTDAMVAGFLAQMESCYALPKSQRVSGTTAASVTATECRALFLGNDPTTFKNNGAMVGANAAWASLFRDGATGVKFSQPVIEFLTPEGKLLVSWKSVATDGGVSYSRVWVKRENGALRAIGNGYQYPFLVRGWSEVRDYLNRPEFAYWATGFEVSITNVTNAGANVFDRVVVTSPNGRQTTFTPSAGLSYMAVQGTNTSVIRLAGKFMNAATTGVPRRLSTTGGENLAWARNPAGNQVDWTDAEIKGIPNVGRWKAEFYLATAPTVVAATQYHETMARPLTLDELTPRVWPALVPAARQAMIAESAPTTGGFITLAAGDLVELSMGGTPPDFWTVPTGAQGPTLVQAQGFLASNNTARWNDSIGISSVARTAVINCSPQTVNDAHCMPSANTYSSDARLNLLQMFAYDARDMVWVSNFATYKMPAITQ